MLCCSRCGATAGSGSPFFRCLQRLELPFIRELRVTSCRCDVVGGCGSFDAVVGVSSGGGDAGDAGVYDGVGGDGAGGGVCRVVGGGGDGGGDGMEL